MKNKTACLTGHRHIDKEKYHLIEKKLISLIKILINKGVLYYGNGGAFGFDLFAANTIILLKKDFPNIKLIMILPCKNQYKYWRKSDILEYKRILLLADKIVYMSNNYYPNCMLHRNNHMLKHSNFCISYCTQLTGGTRYTLDKASKEGLITYNLADLNFDIFN